MEVDQGYSNGGMNAVYLSSLFGKEDARSHKCHHSCQVEHIWANLYRCVTTGNMHVCDKNCNQRILYDNYSSICKVSGQIFPLSAAEQEATRGVRRKRGPDAYETGVFKRRCEPPSRQSCFESMFQIIVPPGQCGSGQSAMDLS